MRSEVDRIQLSSFVEAGGSSCYNGHNAFPESQKEREALLPSTGSQPGVSVYRDIEISRDSLPVPGSSRVEGTQLLWT
jgi:hypothetical protein